MGPTPATSIKVVAQMVAKPGKRDDLKEALLALIEPTRQEQPCQEYELFTDPKNDHTFVFVETWSSQEALDEHLQTPHLQAFFSVAEDLLEEEPLIVTLKLIA